MFKLSVLTLCFFISACGSVSIESEGGSYLTTPNEEVKTQYKPSSH